MIADWCRECKIAKALLQMSELELNETLRRFYAEARNKNGGEYSRYSLLGFRSAVERHFAVNNVQLKLTNNPIFQTSNKMLECKLKVNKREGKENVQHKPVIEPADIKKKSLFDHEPLITILLGSFAGFGLSLLSSGAAGDLKVNVNSDATALPFTKPQMADSLLQCAMKKLPKIIRVESLTNQAMKSKQGCIQLVSSVIKKVYQYIYIYTPQPQARSILPKAEVHSQQ